MTVADLYELAAECRSAGLDYVPMTYDEYAEYKAMLMMTIDPPMLFGMPIWIIH